MTKVIVPELGEGIAKATVSYWFVKEGDKVKEKDDIVEVSTDKATFNVPSPAAGVVIQLLCREGDTVNIGDTVAVIDENQ